jgi:hypothetical protein
MADPTKDPVSIVVTTDIWQEQDPRQSRFVKVIRVCPKSVFIQAVEHDIVEGWLPVRNGATGRDAPVRESKLSRFNGKRGGYKLYERGGEVCG